MISASQSLATFKMTKQQRQRNGATTPRRMTFDITTLSINGAQPNDTMLSVVYAKGRIFKLSC
jgi:hypothetical protein